MTGNGAGDDSSSGEGSGVALKKGPWTAAEDAILIGYVKKHGEGNWNTVQRNSGLARCGKSCRLRWANHLRPNLKKGAFSPEEERLILELHAKLGNKWARMAAQLPGRTDNEIKNYWNTRIKRRQRAGLPLYPPDIQRQAAMSNNNRPSSSAPVKPSLSTPLQLLDSSGPSMTSTSTMSLPFVTPYGQHPPPFLPPPSQRVKRFHEGGTPNFPLAFPPLPAPNQIFSQNFNLPNFQNGFSSFPFNAGAFNLDPPLLHQQAEVGRSSSISMKLELPSSQPLLQPQAEVDRNSSFSMKLELPSSQLPGSGNDSKPPSAVPPINPDRCNSGLLDALLMDLPGSISNYIPNREISVPGCFEKTSSKAPFSSLPLSSTQCLDSPSPNSEIGMNVKREEVEEMDSVVDDELSSLLDIVPPPVTTAPDWYSDSGEASNAQSGVSEEEIGLEMQQLASSFSAPDTADQEWSIGSCPWDNMPNIC